LKTLDPRSVLRRGFALAREIPSQRVLTSAGSLDSGSPVMVQFLGDRLRARVEGIEEGGPRELEDVGEESNGGI
jgi:exonuclease VII large subunit